MSSNTQELELIEKLNQLAEYYQEFGQTDKRNAMLALVKKLTNGEIDHGEITITAKITIEKFNGNTTEGEPVEVQEFEDIEL